MMSYSKAVSQLLKLGNTNKASQPDLKKLKQMEEALLKGPDALAEMVSNVVDSEPGNCSNPSDNWVDYPQRFGMTEQHIPELIEILTNEDLLWGVPGDSPEVWAPIHAARALGQLRVAEALPALVSLFPIIEKMGENANWIGDEFPYIFALIGEPAILVLSGILANDSLHEPQRILASESLRQIGLYNPGSSEQCKNTLLTQLQHYQTNPYALNGFIEGGLCDLKAVEAMDLIREAHAARKVDVRIHGSVEWIEYELGFRAERPKYIYDENELPPELLEEHLSMKKATDKLFGRHFPAQAKSTSTPPPNQRKIGRNDPCPCGSGKKYKKCCLNQGTFAA